MPKLKDTDFLAISAQVRAMETRLLTRERMERMIDARTTEDAIKVLSECGYEELSTLSTTALDQMLAQARDVLYDDLSHSIPTPQILELFQMKYDYHNAKVFLKAHAVGSNPTPLLMTGGRFSPKQLAADFAQETMEVGTPAFRQAIQEATEVLATTGDPQRADLVLDRAYYGEMVATATALGSPFLMGYVRISIDMVNLRAVVRSARMGKGGEFLSHILLPQGNLTPAQLIVAKGDGLVALYRGTPLEAAAALGATLAVPKGAPLTHFERLCDNALLTYLNSARLIPFGEHPVISYLHARESEGTAIRTILSGRLAGLSGEIIRERLRESYV